MVNVKAPYDMVIVQVVYKDRSDIIFIPDSLEKREQAFTGVVIDIGPDYPNKELKLGDHVIFPRHEGYLIETEGQQFYSLRERWILAIIKDGIVCL